MDLQEREMLVARIVSGSVRLEIVDEHGKPLTVVVRTADRDTRYMAQEAYNKAFLEASYGDSYSEDELLTFLVEHGLWSGLCSEEMKGLEDDIEELKVKLVGLVYHSRERELGREALRRAKSRHRELFAQRHAHDHLMAAGLATMSRQRYLIGACLSFADGTKVLQEAGLPSVVFENAVEAWLAARLDESTIRELARTDPWRSIWAARAGLSPFLVPAVDLTDEQLRLHVWSALYENLAAHPQGPSEDVQGDDDLLDGWLIRERRKQRSGEVEKKAEEVITNEKIRNSDEVFIVVGSAADAGQVESLNDEMGRRTRRQREQQVREKGSVDHMDLADVRMWAKLEAAKRPKA